MVSTLLNKEDFFVTLEAALNISAACAVMFNQSIKSDDTANKMTPIPLSTDCLKR
jgi:hypothetical protein